MTTVVLANLEKKSSARLATTPSPLPLLRLPSIKAQNVVCLGIVPFLGRAISIAELPEHRAKRANLKIKTPFSEKAWRLLLAFLSSFGFLPLFELPSLASRVIAKLQVAAVAQE